MKSKIIVTAPTLDMALAKASDTYNIPKSQIRYVIRKDAKSGIFSIIPQRDIEIEVILPDVYQDTQYSDECCTRKGKQIIEEELVPFTELSSSDKETTLAIVQEVIVAIVTTVSTHTPVQTYAQEGCIYIHIEENEDTAILLGKDLEVLKAIQYIVYKIVTQHIRCFFCLHLALGEHVVSEETLLMSMIAKLIEKVKSTYKNQRTYPLNKEQRELVQSMVEQEQYVAIKKQKENLIVQPLTLLYIGPKK